MTLEIKKHNTLFKWAFVVLTYIQNTYIKTRNTIGQICTPMEQPKV